MPGFVRALAAVSALLGLVLAGPAAAHDPAKPGPLPSARDVQAARASVKLHDVLLVDQDGNHVKFRSDVVKDRLVAIDIIYTTCPVVCPILSATFANVQEALHGRLGRDVLLISISVDPVTDVPARLKEYASKWGAKPGWVFLTGDKRSVDTVLRGLNVYAADFTNHPATILVGDGGRQDWTRFYGFPTPEMVRSKLDELAGRR
jgi:protein SCO1/2